MNQIVDAVVQWKFLPILAGAVWAFFLPIWPFLIGVCALIALNRRLGKRAAVMRGEKITDAKAHGSFATAGDYAGLILAAHVFDYAFMSRIPFMGDTELLVTVAAVACGSAELAKIARNVKQLRGVKLGKFDEILNNLQDYAEGKKQE